MDESPQLSLQNQINLLREEVERLKKQIEEMDPSCSFEGMTEAELRHLITHLRPDREMYAGKDCLLGILDSRGVQGVDTFSNKILKALSEEGELDIPHDFDVVEQEIFKKTSLRLWHRKEFLTSMAWTIPGVVLLAKTPLDFAAFALEKSYKKRVEKQKKTDKAQESPTAFEKPDTSVTEPKVTKQKSNSSSHVDSLKSKSQLSEVNDRLKKLQELRELALNEDKRIQEEYPEFFKIYHLVQTLSLISDIPLAAALVYEGIRHDKEMRLEHVADAVSELADRIKEERKRTDKKIVR